MRDPFKPKAKRPKNFIGTWNGQPSQSQLDGFSNQLAGAKKQVQGLIDLSKIKNVPKVTPLPTAERPVTPDTPAFVSVPPVEPVAPLEPVQETVDPFKEQIDTLSSNITASELELSNLASGKVAAQKDAGIFEMQSKLNTDKAKLRELQDKQVEIPLQEKQRYRDAGVVGTKTDLQRATTQDVENAALGAFAQSRNVQAQTDAINTNLAIITQKFDAKKAQLEFDIKQKTKVYDNALKSYGDIMSNKQKVALEAQKQKNAIELEQEKARLKGEKDVSSSLLKLGTTPEAIGLDFTENPENQIDTIKSLINTGDIKAKDGLNMINDIRKGNQEEIDASNAVIDKSDSVIPGIDWLLGEGSEYFEDIHGMWQYSFPGTKERQAKITMDNIKAMLTLDNTKYLKGAMSDKDIVLLQDAASTLNQDMPFEQNLATLKTIKALFVANKDKALRKIKKTNTNQELQKLEAYDTGNQSNAVDKVYNSIVKRESGGSYTAVSKPSRNGDRAYGIAQIMGNNIPSWSKEALGQSLTTKQFLQRPDLQDKIVKYKLAQYWSKYGNARDVASVWFSGQPYSKKVAGRKDVYGTTVKSYTDDIVNNIS